MPCAYTHFQKWRFCHATLCYARPKKSWARWTWPLFAASIVLADISLEWRRLFRIKLLYAIYSGKEEMLKSYTHAMCAKEAEAATEVVWQQPWVEAGTFVEIHVIPHHNCIGKKRLDCLRQLCQSDAIWQGDKLLQICNSPLGLEVDKIVANVVIFTLSVL